MPDNICRKLSGPVRPTNARVPSFYWLCANEARNGMNNYALAPSSTLKRHEVKHANTEKDYLSITSLTKNYPLPPGAGRGTNILSESKAKVRNSFKTPCARLYRSVCIHTPTRLHINLSPVTDQYAVSIFNMSTELMMVHRCQNTR